MKINLIFKTLICLFISVLTFGCNQASINEDLIEEENKYSNNDISILYKIPEFNKFKNERNISNDITASVKFLDYLNSENISDVELKAITSSFSCEDYRNMSANILLAGEGKPKSEVFPYDGIKQPTGTSRVYRVEKSWIVAKNPFNIWHITSIENLGLVYVGGTVQTAFFVEASHSASYLTINTRCSLPGKWVESAKSITPVSLSNKRKQVKFVISGHISVFGYNMTKSNYCIFTAK